MFETKNGVRLFGHPLHALLIHFPMGLLPISLLWDLIAVWTDDSIWWELGFWCAAAGVAFAFFAAVPGFIDYIFISDKPAAEKAALFHMVIMLTAVAFVAVSVLLRIHDHSPEGVKIFLSLCFSLFGVAGLVIGGWFGGELVYRHQIGRK
ncbi:MAG TPA: DUF2231 domain-containing protein [Bacillales bacterium]|nr:DUF2231 domain-containing protein [Bacillales bacterium]